MVDSLFLMQWDLSMQSIFINIFHIYKKKNFTKFFAIDFLLWEEIDFATQGWASPSVRNIDLLSFF